MKKIIISFLLLLIPFLVLGDPGDPLFNAIDVDGADVEEGWFEYVVKLAFLIFYVVILLGIGYYVTKSVWGLVQSHGHMMNSRSADGGADNTRTTANVVHLIIAIVVFILLLVLFGTVNEEVESLFASSNSIDGTFQYSQMELIKRSA